MVFDKDLTEFSPLLMVFDKDLYNGKRFFPETWDLSPTGIGEILKSNTCCHCNHIFKECSCEKPLKTLKSSFCLFILFMSNWRFQMTKMTNCQILGQPII